MLEHTFCHIPGIGAKTEARLWRAGVEQWRDWREPPPVTATSYTPGEGQRLLDDSAAALGTDPAFFTRRLASHESWRIFDAFRPQSIYLDIETTGAVDMAEITTIATFDGREVRTYVNGRNIDDFIDDIMAYTVIVSYNGRSFDVPFIERFFKTRLPQAQIDLRYVLARLGFKGGLKGCERQLGLNRGGLDGVDGSYAIPLWYLYANGGDERALETLLAYNVEDAVNLERLAVEAYNRNVLATPFGDRLLLACPPPPPNPHLADLTIIDTIRRSRPPEWYPRG